MKRRNLIIALVVLTLVGSLFFMLASNMFFSDILNMSAAGLGGGFLVTLSSVSVAMFFLLAILYLLRTYRHPDCVKRITRLYSIILMVLGFVGLLGDILAGATYYKSFLSSHPFPGYLIIFLILNLLLIACGVLAFLRARKMEEDKDRVKISFRYVIKTIGWFLFLCLLLNRLGNFLVSPTFIYWRNFGLTFPVYLCLLLPLFLGILETFHILGILDDKKIRILAFVALGLDVFYFAYTAIVGINDTGFISSLSQIMPLERMLGKPIELPIHFLAYAGVVAALLVQLKKKPADAE